MEAVSQALVNFLGLGATSIARLFLAVGVLALGWVFAKLVSKVLRQILITADFDRRLSKWLDLEAIHESAEKPKKQMVTIIEKVVFYLIILLFLIFALELLGDKTISGVLQNILATMSDAVPRLLKALLIFAGAWFIAIVLKFAAIKLMRKLEASKRLSAFLGSEGEENGEEHDVARAVGNFIFYFILLFALLPFLDALTLGSLVGPVQSMLSKVLNFVPNAVAALVVLVLGYFLARLCERISGNFAQAAGINRFIEGMRFESVLKSLNIAKIIGTVVFLLVMVPILATAFQILKIPVVTAAFGKMINRVSTAIPSILGAFVILVIGLIIARYLGDLTAQILRDVGFDVILGRIGLGKLEPKEKKGDGAKQTLSIVAGNLVMAVVVLFFLMESFRLIHLDLVADAIDRLILFLPSLFIAFLILGVGFYLGRVIEDLVRKSFASERSLEANVVAVILRYAVIVFAFFMAFDELGIAHSVVVSAFTILLATAGLGLALAFGLGGREQAGDYLQHLKERAEDRKKKGSKDS